MAIFVGIFVLLLIGSLFVKKKSQKIGLYLAFVVLFILSAFREFNVGTDTISYLHIFNRVKIGREISQEIGWGYLNSILINLGGDFTLLLIICALLVLIPVFYITYKYSPNPLLSIALFIGFYLYLQSFNIIRQSIAVSIVFMGIICLYNKKKWGFILLILLASTFHISALICLPLVFINYIPDNKGLYAVLIVMSYFVGFMLTNILLSKIVPLLGYEHYLNADEAMVQTGIFILLINAFFLFVLFTTKEKGVFFKVYFIFVFLVNLLQGVPYNDRLTNYFSIIQIIFLPIYIYNFKVENRILFSIAVVLYSGLCFYRLSGGGGIVPYSNVLFP